MQKSNESLTVRPPTQNPKHSNIGIDTYGLWRASLKAKISEDSDFFCHTRQNLSKRLGLLDWDNFRIIFTKALNSRTLKTGSSLMNQILNS